MNSITDLFPYLCLDPEFLFQNFKSLYLDNYVVALKFLLLPLSFRVSGHQQDF